MLESNLCLGQHILSCCHKRDVLLREGIWDMIRVDHGTESCLMLFIQNLLRNERGNMTCEPYMQTRSRQVSVTNYHAYVSVQGPTHTNAKALVKHELGLI